MKKILLVVAIFIVVATHVKAQIGFVITDTVNTSIDVEVDSVYMESKAHTFDVTDSVCNVDLYVWFSQAAKDEGAQRIIIKDDEGVFVDHISIIWYITDSGIDIINKVKAKLTDLYGWVIE